ncbi:MAG: ATP-binding cassette domain-containing protein [Planctomycetes bacterium]|nr:ATP-binding cassette domain-containing protein [Planctomycetota bacterium]
MIEVEQLAKSYGFAQALKGVSFTVQKGEVVGFLGPNGAGKSTTMKILTGYLLPTSGRASVAGHDVVAASVAARRCIGYLPETTPLYGEMRVDEYLRFCAEIRGIPADRQRGAIGRAVERCALQRVLGKNIVELSKGYKQRVGLAQAIVHEPPVLILDEPTSGLDPNQIVEVRSLIEKLGKEHTVILSTHYLQEVEKSCTRVVIIDQGRIVADGTQAQITAVHGGSALRVRVRGPADEVRAQLRQLLPPGAPLAAEGGGDGVTTWRLGLPAAAAEFPSAIAAQICRHGWQLLELAVERASLEDIFRQLTGRKAQEAVHA